MPQPAAATLQLEGGLGQVKVWSFHEFAKSRYLHCGTAIFAIPKGVLSGLARVGARENWWLAKLLLYYPAS